ncbi:hypothetical protein PROFUN_15657, partial [Planoprotostelium fungivorum]
QKKSSDNLSHSQGSLSSLPMVSEQEGRSRAESYAQIVMSETDHQPTDFDEQARINLEVIRMERNSEMSRMFGGKKGRLPPISERNKAGIETSPPLRPLRLLSSHQQYFEQ